MSAGNRFRALRAKHHNEFTGAFEKQVIPTLRHMASCAKCGKPVWCDKRTCVPAGHWCYTCCMREKVATRASATADSPPVVERLRR